MVIVSPSNVTMRFRSSGDMPKARTHDTGMDIDVPIAFFPAFPPVFLNMILRCLSSIIFSLLNNLYVSHQIYHDQELHHSQPCVVIKPLDCVIYHDQELHHSQPPEGARDILKDLSLSGTTSLSNQALHDEYLLRDLSLSGTTSLSNRCVTLSRCTHDLSLSGTTSLSNLTLIVAPG